MSAVFFNIKSALICAAVLLLTACGQSTDSTPAEDLSATTEQTLPDWGGWWTISGGPAAGLPAALLDLDVYQPEARRIIEEVRVPGTNLGGGSVYCVTTRFNGGGNGGGTDDVEFLLMPQRLTITNGDGLLRRIPIDGRALRESPEPSNGGTSVGHWEGDTLIVETIGLHADTTFPTASRPNSPLIGENVHVMERMRLNAEDQLAIDTVLTAPQMLIESLVFTTLYDRDPGYVYRDHDRCSLNDRSIDPETGLERFDLTPPADLPPPPPPN
jgi:hypothetical protein|tara:strand:+ start:20541 stop:21353 length:813 start_codon:yes stop_codon:yes gene_type:complete